MAGMESRPKWHASWHACLKYGRLPEMASLHCHLRLVAAMFILGIFHTSVTTVALGGCGLCQWYPRPGYEPTEQRFAAKVGVRSTDVEYGPHPKHASSL
eukprot:5847466-Prymnesium_polylepis.2